MLTLYREQPSLVTTVAADPTVQKIVAHDQEQ